MHAATDAHRSHPGPVAQEWLETVGAAELSGASGRVGGVGEQAPKRGTGRIAWARAVSGGTRSHGGATAAAARSRAAPEPVSEQPEPAVPVASGASCQASPEQVDEQDDEAVMELAADGPGSVVIEPQHEAAIAELRQSMEVVLAAIGSLQMLPAVLAAPPPPAASPSHDPLVPPPTTSLRLPEALRVLPPAVRRDQVSASCVHRVLHQALDAAARPCCACVSGTSLAW